MMTTVKMTMTATKNRIKLVAKMAVYANTWVEFLLFFRVLEVRECVRSRSRL